MRLAYVVSRYPLVSHTFVEREVREMRALGVAVDTFTVRRPDPAQILSAPSLEEAGRTRVLVGDVASLLRGLVAAARHPGALLSFFVASFRSVRGLRRRVRQVLYAGEAVVLWWHAGRDGVDHVHAHFANVGADVARAAARLRRKTDPESPWTWSFTMHGPTEFAAVEDFDLRNKVIDADLVICISEFCRSQLMALVDEQHWDKLAVVHCGVDPAAFSPPTRREEAGRRPVRVLCVGRLVGVKGQAVLLQALARLIGEGVDVEMALVGDGPRGGHLRSEAERLGLSEAVTFTGAVGQDGIGSWYRWADVFCLPSFAEGVPVVLMEAMATGLPVVTTTIAGIPELVEHGRSGLLVPPGRADLLASALRTLVADPELRTAMGAHGREAVIAGFTQRESAARLLDELSAAQRSRSGRQRPRAAEANKRTANGRSSTR